MEKVSNPDETVELLANECKGCHNDMHFQQTDKYETRQAFEVILKRKVKEYKAEVKECDICGTVTIGEFPDGVTKAVQYGNSVKGLSVYMSQYQLIPYERVEGFFNDFFKIPLSKGTIYNFNERTFDMLSGLKKKLKKHY